MENDEYAEIAASSRGTRLPEGDLRVAAGTLVEERLRGVRRSVERDLEPVDVLLDSTGSDARRHLLEEACELYWNELSWEEITDEERIGEDSFTEMVFPGLLAFVDALLPRNRNGEPDRDHEHRDVAHDFLLWLAARLVELRGTEPSGTRERLRVRRERAITDELLDLVVYRLYALSDAEITRLQRR